MKTVTAKAVTIAAKETTIEDTVIQKRENNNQKSSHGRKMPRRMNVAVGIAYCQTINIRRLSEIAKENITRNGKM